MGGSLARIRATGSAAGVILASVREDPRRITGNPVGASAGCSPWDGCLSRWHASGFPFLEGRKPDGAGRTGRQRPAATLTGNTAGAMNEDPHRPGGRTPAGRPFAAGRPTCSPGPASPPVATAPTGGPRLLDRVRLATRVRHYSRRTERAYVGWTRRYVLYHHKRHPSEMGAAEIRDFLNHLATELKVSAATQNQALCALVFLYRHVLETEIGHLDGLVRAKRPVHLPVVLTPGEAGTVLRKMTGA